MDLLQVLKGNMKHFYSDLPFIPNIFVHVNIATGSSFFFLHSSQGEKIFFLLDHFCVLECGTIEAHTGVLCLSCKYKGCFFLIPVFKIHLVKNTICCTYNRLKFAAERHFIERM